MFLFIPPPVPPGGSDQTAASLNGGLLIIIYTYLISNTSHGEELTDHRHSLRLPVSEKTAPGYHIGNRLHATSRMDVINGNKIV